MNSGWRAEDDYWAMGVAAGVLMLIAGVLGFIWETDAHNFLWVRISLTGLIVAGIGALGLSVNQGDDAHPLYIALEVLIAERRDMRSKLERLNRERHESMA